MTILNRLFLPYTPQSGLGLQPDLPNHAVWL
jgi:hypothetical protein